MASRIIVTPKQTQTVSFVLDFSGSMDWIARDLENSYKREIAKLREEADKNNVPTTVNVYVFGTRINRLYSNVPLHGSTLDTLKYQNMGGTALYDAIGTARDDYGRENMPAKGYVDALLVLAITDGEENRSLTQASVIDQKIGDLQSTNRWTFAFHLPKGYATSFKSRFRISSDNIREWETTEEGLRDVVKTSSEGMVNYYTSRSMGATATKSFFADLSNVKSTDLRQLNDLSGQLQSFEVNKETDIRSFVEDKTGQYTAGTAYYELSKPETVQPSKDILVMERGKKTVYGGQQARQLLGLPNNQTVRLKIQNLSNYRVFVRSDSQNRKLVRGTTVFVKK